jgi:NAD kinase
MERLTENKIILVKRKTRLEELISRYNTIAQAQFYIEHLGSDFSDYLQENEQYKKAVSDAQGELEQLGRVQVVDREYVPNFLFGKSDVVVAVGQDGLVANTLKYLTDQLLIGVNPDPARWDGVLLPFKVSDLRLVVQDVFRMKRPVKEVTMAKAEMNDGQTLYAVNDLFVGQKTHVSSRYRIRIGKSQEAHSSSGIIISTGLGSTGWMKSVMAGAEGIMTGITAEAGIPGHPGAADPARSGGKPLKTRQKPMGWNAEYLYFSVREPFPSKTTKTDLVFGKITRSNPLVILSQMPENGVIFSDGIETDCLQFNSGLEARITLAEKKGHLVV